MAKATKRNSTSKGKRTAPKPVTAGSSQPAAVQPAKGTAVAKAVAPQAPLYVPGSPPAVRPGTHRAYAQAIAVQCLKAAPKGFTLVAFRAALVASTAASSISPPAGGWQAHNMPTWCANPKQAWLVPA